MSHEELSFPPNRSPRRSPSPAPIRCTIARNQAETKQRITRLSPHPPRLLQEQIVRAVRPSTARARWRRRWSLVSLIGRLRVVSC